MLVMEGPVHRIMPRALCFACPVSGKTACRSPIFENPQIRRRRLDGHAACGWERDICWKVIVGQLCSGPPQTIFQQKMQSKASNNTICLLITCLLAGWCPPVYRVDNIFWLRSLVVKTRVVKTSVVTIVQSFTRGEHHLLPRLCPKFQLLMNCLRLQIQLLNLNSISDPWIFGKGVHIQA